MKFAARHWSNFSLNLSSIFRCQNQHVCNCLSSRICWCAWLNGSIPFYLCSVTRIIGVLVQVLALILHSARSSNRKNDFVHSNRNIICVRLWCSVLLLAYSFALLKIELNVWQPTETTRMFIEFSFVCLFVFLCGILVKSKSCRSPYRGRGAVD